MQEKETFESLQEEFVRLWQDQDKIIQEKGSHEYMNLRARTYDRMCKILDKSNNFITKQ